MSAYQAVAENGVRVFQHDGMIVKMQDMEPFSGADAVMLLDSNWGNGVMTLLSLDPDIVNESSGRNLKPGFELYNPENGYALEGAHYSEKFVADFHKAQEKRTCVFAGASGGSTRWKIGEFYKCGGERSSSFIW